MRCFNFPFESCEFKSLLLPIFYSECKQVYDAKNNSGLGAMALLITDTTIQEILVWDQDSLYIVSILSSLILEDRDSFLISFGWYSIYLYTLHLERSVASLSSWCTGISKGSDMWSDQRLGLNPIGLMPSQAYCLLQWVSWHYQHYYRLFCQSILKWCASNYRINAYYVYFSTMSIDTFVIGLSRVSSVNVRNIMKIIWTRIIISRETPSQKTTQQTN